MPNATKVAAASIGFDLVTTAQAAPPHADWTDKYQPRVVNGLILPASLKQLFASIAQSANSSSIPNILLCGSTGSGKTATIDAIIAESRLDRHYINGALDNGIDMVRKLIRTVSLQSLYGHRAVFIDELDGLSAQAFSALRGDTLTTARVTSVFFATANDMSKIPDTIRSRFNTIDLGSAIKATRKQLLPLHIDRAVEILDNEGISYDRKVIANIVESRFPDMRSWISDLQFRSATGQIDTM
ncbi:MAG: AAA family ATPase [Afipia sp.]|nr:AAA family ATPase [Afipia sp.]